MLDDFHQKLKDTDVEIGKFIRYFRKLNGFTQVGLGEPLGISYQQLQKYEQGLNSISAARLKLAADVLAVPVELFYGRSSGAIDVGSEDAIEIMKLAGEMTDSQRRALKLFLRAISIV